MTNSDGIGIDFRFVGDVTAMASAFDFHDSVPLLIRARRLLLFGRSSEFLPERRKPHERQVITWPEKNAGRAKRIER